jgi:hypothetical protein
LTGESDDRDPAFFDTMLSALDSSLRVDRAHLPHGPLERITARAIAAQPARRRHRRHRNLSSAPPAPLFATDLILIGVASRPWVGGGRRGWRARR